MLRRGVDQVDLIVEGIFPRVIHHLAEFATVITHLRRTSAIILTKSVLQHLSSTYFDYTTSREGARWWDSDRTRIGAVAGVLYDIFNTDKNAQILLGVVKGGTGVDSLSIQRSCVLAISQLGRIDEVIQNILATWSDKVYIEHTPVVAQEGTCPQIK